ncbi:ECF transporter S component [Clostridium algidicarnis]|uniref:ECF transporter S component n=1 Tax=Clostridium algidicarnis TaxID=37659 RepID=UPI001C0AEFAD|nr:ECF transporter S component [Clostridium algidicarnis]MBU3194122.1 ECF transporter S component [Clostridium algidicarnis]
MKKLIMIISILMPFSMAIISLTLKDYDKLSFYLTVFVIATLVINFLYLEKSKKGTKEIALIATLSAVAAVSRVPFSGIPGVQPTTFLVALSGLVFGSYEGFLVGSTAAFISNIFLGQGPWTPWQMMAWGIVGAVSGLIGLRNKKPSIEMFALICFIYGFAFDWIMNIWHVIGFVRPINWKTILAAYATGLPFDIMHAVGNFIFVLILYDKFYNVLNRYKDRLYYTYTK